MFKTYLLYSESKNRFYVAHTSDIEDRIKRHNSGKSKSTK
ncbi:GIY-YIG nuclease family protein [Winogradskyella forsetii]|nr:GIY-YIG nuclease family protein [Winogradskyella forsetii]